MLQNDDYIKFADKSSVEFLALGDLEKGVAAKDKRAATYTKEENGQKFEYLVEFPNLTIEEVVDCDRSKGAAFNDTGHIPFCCIVDPWTEKEITRLPTISVAKIQEAFKEAKKQLVKDHGPGLERAQIKAMSDAEKESKAAADSGDFTKALAALDKATKTVKDAQPLMERMTAAHDAVIAKANDALKAAIEQCDADPAAGKKALTALASKLKGTGLEKQVADKLKELAGGAAASSGG